MRAKLLILDDDVAGCDALGETLEHRGFEVVRAYSGAEALLAIERGDFAAVVTDLNMPAMSGTDLCRRVYTTQPNLPIIVVTAFGTIDTAVAAIRAGAYDFIAKPIQIQELLLTLGRALEHRTLKEENKQLRDAVAEQRPPSNMIGESPVMREVYQLLSQTMRLPERDSRQTPRIERFAPCLALQ